MNFYILCLFLFNFIVEFGYVIGQVSEECKIYNTLKNLPDTDCCLQEGVCDGQGYVQFLYVSINLKVNKKYLNVYLSII